MQDVKTNDYADLTEASPRDVDNRGLTLHSGILEPSLNEQHVMAAVGIFGNNTCSETRDQSLSRLTPGW